VQVHKGRQPQTIFHLQLGKDRRQVVPHGSLGNPEPGGNLFIPEPAAYQGKELALLPRQLLDASLSLHISGIRQTVFAVTWPTNGEVTTVTLAQHLKTPRVDEFFRQQLCSMDTSESASQVFISAFNPDHASEPGRMTYRHRAKPRTYFPQTSVGNHDLRINNQEAIVVAQAVPDFTVLSSFDVRLLCLQRPAYVACRIRDTSGAPCI
jgi:hypothetical protein